MADWSKPTILSDYVVFVDEVKARDVDAISLQKNALTNPPTGSIRLLRSPVKFQEWSGSAFVDQVLALEGGGTGSTTAAGARTNFGLGTMAVQNSNAVAVTGGTLAGVTFNGPITHNGGTLTVNQNVGHGFVAYGPPTGAGYAGFFLGSSTPGGSFGLIVQAGIVSGDYAFQIRNYSAVQEGIRIRGDMTCLLPYRLVIPVGTDLWAIA